MTITKLVARTRNGFEEWTVEFSEEAPWRIKVSDGDGGVFEAEGVDLFRALQQVRREIESHDVLLCCNGARRNARPSPQASDSGGGMVYLLPLLRAPTGEDLVPLLGKAPLRNVGSVSEQERFWEKYSSSTLFSVVRLASPLRLVKGITQLIAGPSQWLAYEEDGVIRWRKVRR